MLPYTVYVYHLLIGYGIPATGGTATWLRNVVISCKVHVVLSRVTGLQAWFRLPETRVASVQMIPLAAPGWLKPFQFCM